MATRIRCSGPGISGLGSAILAAISLALPSATAFAKPDASRGNKDCVDFCKFAFPPGAERGQCIAQAAHGEGACYEGFCLPVREGEDIKDKQPYDEKLAELLATASTPSAFAGAFFQLANGFLSGRAPANDLETSAFAILDQLPSATRQVLACSARRYEALDEADRVKLFGPAFATPTSAPLEVSALTQAVASEFNQRLSANAFAEQDPAACLEGERAGLAREGDCGVPNPDGGGPPQGFCPRICKMRTPSLTGDIRTIGFLPTLQIGEYRPEEQEWAVEIDPVTGKPDWSSVVPPNCTGNERFDPPGLCLAVPNTEAGSTVVLSGYGFSDVDLQVVLDAQPPLSLVRRVDAHVCGDVETPADAPLDCNVIRDRLTFGVPEDLPPGLYEVRIELPGGDAADISSFNPFLRVLPPANARFSLASEELRCNDETGRFDFTGSDEVALRISTVPVVSDGTFGDMSTEVFRYGDMDSGDRRRLDRVHFSDEIRAGMAFTLIGYEVDMGDPFSEDAIRDFEDAWGKVLQSNWGTIADDLGKITALGVTAAGYAQYAAVAGEIVNKATILFVSLWAPADLIMEDADGISSQLMGELTSIDFPDPPAREGTTANGIGLTVEPCADTPDRDRAECDPTAKIPNQYRERREYRSSKEHSNYQATFRYNRLPLQ